MNEEEKKTRFLRDLDRVRKQLSEIEEEEMERTQKEQILKEQKFHLLKLLGDLSIGVLSVDIQGKINFMNKSAHKILRIDPSQEPEKMEVWNHPDFVKSGISKGIRNCLDSQKRSFFDAIYEDEEGKRFFLKNTFSPLFHKDGSIDGVMVTIQDETEKKKSNIDLNQKLKYEKFLSKILFHLTEFNDLEASLNQILIEIGNELDAERNGIFLFDEKNDLVNCFYERQRKGIESRIDNRKNMPLDKFSWMIEKFINKQPVQIKKTTEMEKKQKSIYGFCIDEETLSFLAVPIYSKDKLTGFLGVEWISKQGNWAENDGRLLMEIAQKIGSIIEKKKLSDSERKASDRFCFLAKAGFEAIVILKDRKIIDANHAASSLFEYRPSEYIGKDWSVFFDSGEKKVIEENIDDSKSRPIESKGIKKSGEVVPVEILTKTIFDENERLEVLGIRDITERERVGKDVREEYESLKEIIDEIVKALAFSVELKDPYTAGHMQRVTRLACAIAEEVGLDEEKISGLKVAASIHDIGKISIPAEILSKPDKLSEAERMIVEGHPKAGYDILKNINFPWPVVDIVLQHHERMNGSGYPSGLSGNKILIEARIIAVADIVEALTSRRPHRSAQEKEIPINELKKNKANLYDPEVVDACLKIITRKNFSFQTFGLSG